jgi:polyphosphate kinase
LLSNLSTSWLFWSKIWKKETSCYARVKVPGVLKQWIALEAEAPAGQRVFIPLHEVIRRKHRQPDSFLALVEREIANKKTGLPARIVAKMNQLEDPELIEAVGRHLPACRSI